MFTGPVVYDYLDAKKNLRNSGYVFLRDKSSPFSRAGFVVWADVTSDETGAWFLVENAFPRVSSVYQAGAVGDIPRPGDGSMTKLHDDSIRTILANGNKETRTQWFHTSEASGTVWADGSLNNSSTMYNQFEDPGLWSSTSSSSGARFKRRQGPGSTYSDWITSAGNGCSGAVGGWSNYYNASCIISWFAGCEGAPAYNHCCACPVDRAQQLIIWAR